jgi:dihydrolipoamide dehydrogenase
MEILVVGGGPAGYFAAIRAAQLNAHVTLVERGEVGGTCLNRGCIPTKSLLSDLKIFRSAEKSDFITPKASSDFDLLDKVMENKQSRVQNIVSGVRLLIKSYNINIVNAEADFSSASQIVLKHQNGQIEKVYPKKSILCLGSKPKVLPGFHFDGDTIISSDEALDINNLPSEITIIGGGYIGAEFATIYNLLGSKVNLVEMESQILPGIDQEISRYLTRCFALQGINVFTSAKVLDLNSGSNQVVLTIETPKEKKELRSEKLLVSVGREANLNMDFAATKIALKNGYLKTDPYLKTTADNIYAAGDATGGALLAYVASEEGILAAENAVGMKNKVEARTLPVCVFSQPGVAYVGLTEKEARRDYAIKVGRFPFRSNPKAIIQGEKDGMIKVISCKESDTVLGIHIIGCDADTLVSAAAVVVDQKLKVSEFSKMLQIHPSSSEALKEAFLDVNKIGIHVPKITQS